MPFRLYRYDCRVEIMCLKILAGFPAFGVQMGKRLYDSTFGMHYNPPPMPKWYLDYCRHCTSKQLYSQYFCPNVSVYLSIYLRLFADFATAAMAAAPRRSVSTNSICPHCGYMLNFPVHCASVTNMSPHYNLSPLSRYIANISTQDLLPPSKNTTNLLNIELLRPE